MPRMRAASGAEKATEGHLGYRTFPYCGTLIAVSVPRFLVGSCPWGTRLHLVPGNRRAPAATAKVEPLAYSHRPAMRLSCPQALLSATPCRQDVPVCCAPSLLVHTRYTGWLLLTRSTSIKAAMLASSPTLYRVWPGRPCDGEGGAEGL